MSVVFPDKPGLKTAKGRLLDWGGRLVPILGGPVQTLTRLGTRLSLELTLPLMPSEPMGRIWVGKLIEGKLSDVIAPFVQDGFAVGLPGTPVVNGAGASGTTLPIRSARADYVFRYGQFISLVSGGRRYLHMVTAVTRVAAGGTASLPIVPMLRVIPSDGDTVDVSKPKIQGSLIGEDVSWDVLTEPYVQLPAIRIDEDR